MHACQIVAFLLFAAAAIIAVTERAWVLALIGAGLAVALVPAVFQLTS